MPAPGVAVGRFRRQIGALPMKVETFLEPSSLVWAGASLFVAAGLLWSAVGPGSNQHVLRHVLLDEVGADDEGVTFELVGPRPPFGCMSKTGDGKAHATYQFAQGEVAAPWPGGTYGDVHLTVTDGDCLLTRVDRRRPDGTLVEETQEER